MQNEAATKHAGYDNLQKSTTLTPASGGRVASSIKARLRSRLASPLLLTKAVEKALVPRLAFKAGFNNARA